MCVSIQSRRGQRAQIEVRIYFARSQSCCGQMNASPTHDTKPLSEKNNLESFVPMTYLHTSSRLDDGSSMENTALSENPTQQGAQNNSMRHRSIQVRSLREHRALTLQAESRGHQAPSIQPSVSSDYGAEDSAGLTSRVQKETSSNPNDESSTA